MQGLKRYLSQMSLFRRLAILGAVLVLGVAALVAYVIQEPIRATQEHIMRERLVVAKAAALSLDKVMHHVVFEMQATAAQIRPDHASPQAGQNVALLQSLLDRSEGLLVALALVDDQGRLTVSAPDGVFQSGMDLHNMHPSSVEVLSDARGFVSAGWLTLGDGTPGIALIVTAPGAEPSSYGFLLGVVDPSSGPLADTLRSTVALITTGHADLLDSENHVIASTEDHALRGMGDHPTFYQEMSVYSLPTIRIVPHEEGPPGENHLMAYVPLSDVPWALAAGGSEAEAFASVQEFQRRLYWLTGTVLVLVMVGGLVGAGRLVRPVHVLSDAARRLAQGELGEKIAVREGGEIGDLAADMDRMRVRLKGSLEDIQQLNQVLEQRISERTAELEQRNREMMLAAAIAAQVTSFIRLQEVLDHTLESVAEAIRQESLAIFLLDREGRGLTLTASQGLSMQFAALEASVNLGECLCGRVAETGEPTALENIGAEPLATRPACVTAGYDGIAVFPLQSRERVEGVLAVLSPKANNLSAQDSHVLTLICHQIGIAIQNARLYAEVEEKEEISARLVEKVISAQEEERRRLASELHDETGQALTGITLSLEALGTTLPSEMKTARQQLRSMQHVTQDALGELRKMVLALRPSALDDLGLVPAVRRYAQQYLESAGMTVTIDADGSSPALEPSIETMVFRVVQEAINNAARHSKASHVAIRFWQSQQEFYVEVQDDGVGFEPEAVSRSSKPSASLGLLGMHERANLVNGRVTIHSQPAHGTKVLVCVPNRVRGSSA